MYALDKHTRLGREAIRRFASENDEVRETLARFVPAARRNDAAYMAAFYADAAPLATKLVWKGADESGGSSELRQTSFCRACRRRALRRCWRLSETTSDT